MFERFAQMAQARRALAAGDWERAGRLAAAPKLAGCRGAGKVLDRALGKLMDRARKRWVEGDAKGAAVDLERVLALRPGDPVAEGLRTEMAPTDQLSEADRPAAAGPRSAQQPRASHPSDDRGAAQAEAKQEVAQGGDPDLPPGQFLARVEAADQQIECGDWHGARMALTAALTEHPDHSPARKLLARIDGLEAAQESALAEARSLAREGRLRTALAKVEACSGKGSSGDAPRALLAELSERIAVVERGVDEISAGLHRPEGGSAAGMQHFLARLQELARNDREHPQISGLIATVEGALAAHAQLRPALDALGDGDRVPAMQLLQVVPEGAPLVRPARKELVEGVTASLEQDLEAAACGVVDRDMALLDSAVGISAASEDVSPACVVRLNRVCTQLRKRRDAAEAAATKAEKRLRKALATADHEQAAVLRRETRRLIAEARQEWADDGPLDTVEARLIAADTSATTLEQAARWAREGDPAQARRHLAAAGATPPALKTRIYDMKRDLARAQGLADGFLLQVDDAGEFLVMRGETIRIGNIRGGPLELPVLANIASQHARIERRMSFHGGMQDHILATDGELRHGGKTVSEHRLQSGDQVTLGESLSLRYRLPSKRSLTAELRILGGFQVAGTDRILLMKDRGRDGRIILGPGDGTHVRVPTAEGALEIYASPDGRVLVRAPEGGTLDGKRFQGEQVLEAGCTVRAAGATFVVQPWSPEDR